MRHDRHDGRDTLDWLGDQCTCGHIRYEHWFSEDSSCHHVYVNCNPWTGALEHCKCARFAYYAPPEPLEQAMQRLRRKWGFL